MVGIPVDFMRNDDQSFAFCDVFVLIPSQIQMYENVYIYIYNPVHGSVTRLTVIDMHLFIQHALQKHFGSRQPVSKHPSLIIWMCNLTIPETS